METPADTSTASETPETPEGESKSVTLDIHNVRHETTTKFVPSEGDD